MHASHFARHHDSDDVYVSDVHLSDDEYQRLVDSYHVRHDVPDES